MQSNQREKKSRFPQHKDDMTTFLATKRRLMNLMCLGEPRRTLKFLVL